MEGGGCWSMKSECRWHPHSSAPLSSAGPVLTGWLPPVCLESLRKGQIKVRAKGHNTASTLNRIHMREEKKKKTHHTCSLGSYRSLSASLLFYSSYQSPNNTSPSPVAKRLAFGKVKSSLEPNAAHSRKSWGQNQQSPYCNWAGQIYVNTRMMKSSSSLDLQKPGLGTILGLQFCDFFQSCLSFRRVTLQLNHDKRICS